MLRALIVDDEIASIKSLEILLNKFCKQVEVIGKAQSINEALEVVIKYKPDIVFLDIEMPSGTGFDFLERCPEITFDVIFITAYNNYAVKAFKYSAIDYILKPIEIDELVRAVEKISNQKKKEFNSSNKYKALFENLKELIPQKLVVTSNGKYEYIDLRSVVFLEQKENSIILHLENKLTLEIDESIELIEEQLIERNFFRIQQNCMINIQKVSKIIKQNGYCIELTNGILLPVTNSKRDELIQKLSEINIHHT